MARVSSAEICKSQSLRAMCASSWERTMRRRSSGQSVASEGSTMTRSEEHTSELQSHSDLVCRLLLEKKKKYKTQDTAQAATLREGRNGAVRPHRLRSNAV